MSGLRVEPVGPEGNAPSAGSAPTLFDPMPYGPSRADRSRRDSSTPRLIPNDGTWYALRHRTRGPDPKAHRIVGKVIHKGGWLGAYQTVCGLTGAVVKIEGAVELQPCGYCEARFEE